ncbi:hypothetical protein HPB48_014684 [Haemaphysalis longicornis]|uniref:Uncharacterized protein n=1 Tax=Haemaphysalis longicornis TaxID=44386 RepID=A0A9J6GI33_HAELO|nr:hypothetical protein HPB48_014684 [Haemaphysalis longicornis]
MRILVDHQPARMPPKVPSLPRHAHHSVQGGPTAFPAPANGQKQVGNSRAPRSGNSRSPSPRSRRNQDTPVPDPKSREAAPQDQTGVPVAEGCGRSRSRGPSPEAVPQA